jgi:hypothetical protein
VQVVRVGFAGVVDADLVEAGEGVVVACHGRVAVDDAGLVGDDLDGGGAAPAVQADLDRLSGA